MVDIHLEVGDKIYVGGKITALFGADISGDPYLIALSTTRVGPPADDPAWVTPTLSEQGDTTSERLIYLLVQPPTPSGRYYALGRVADDPEAVSGILQRNVNVYT